MKTKKLLKFLSSNKITMEQALEMLEMTIKGKLPKEKAVIGGYEKRGYDAQGNRSEI